MEMTYSCGWVAEMASDPVWLGSFVRCTLEHPELFRYHCPACGKVVQALGVLVVVCAKLAVFAGKGLGLS